MVHHILGMDGCSNNTIVMKIHIINLLYKSINTKLIEIIEKRFRYKEEDDSVISFFDKWY